MVEAGATGSVENPLNREPSVHELVETFLTPLSIAYDRNHGPIPNLSDSDHAVKVCGNVKQATSLSITSLKLMPQHEVVCTLQCAGNRRHTMRTSLKEVQGIDWGDAAVMNCQWKGPLLRDILLQVGVDASSASSSGQHVAFGTWAQKTQNDEFYGASITLEKALDPAAEAILALEMNGEPLPPKHGAPVRVIVPGVAGARCVKWLQEICVQAKESSCFYQQRDYKILPPEAVDSESAAKFWDETPSLQEMPLNSVIGSPSSGSEVQRDEEGIIKVVGYALPSGMGGPVEKVEVSTDEGVSWTEASLLWGEGTERGKWCWCLWTARVKIETGANKKIWSRAKDQLGVWQEKSGEWNLRGMAYNGYGEVDELDVCD